MRYTRLPEDAAIGAVLSVFFGLGLVLISHIQTLGTGGQGGITKFIYGQTATMRAWDASVIGLVAVAVIVAAFALFKEFRLVCFDQEFAGTQGWPISAIDLMMMSMVVIVTVIGLQAVGLILIVALVIIPAAAARFWTDRLWVMTVAAAVIGGASGYFGAGASALFPGFSRWRRDRPWWPGPSSPSACCWRPTAASCSPPHARSGCASTSPEQHILRSLFEAEETGHTAGVSLEELSHDRGTPRLSLRLLTRLMAATGLVIRKGPHLTLTKAGRQEGFRVTRNHKALGAVPDRLRRPGAVPRRPFGPTSSSTYFPPTWWPRLERRLTEIGRLPKPLSMPESPHPLGPCEPATQEARP